MRGLLIIIDVNELKKNLVKINKFKIMKIIERKGLAKFKKEDPIVCRLVMKIIK